MKLSLGLYVVLKGWGPSRRSILDSGHKRTSHAHTHIYAVYMRVAFRAGRATELLVLGKLRCSEDVGALCAPVVSEYLGLTVSTGLPWRGEGREHC